MDGSTIALIKALGGSGSVEDLTTSGGKSDAGNVLVVGDDGKIKAVALGVGEGEVAVDESLSVSGAAADAYKTGKEIAAVNTSLQSKASTDVATQSANGLMSSADKTKLDNIGSVVTVSGSSGLTGKKVVFFGDSISYGEGNNGHSFVDIIDEMGICASLVKEAHTSSCVGPYQVYSDGAGYDLIAMIELQATAVTNADIVFCAYSGNDSHAVSVGNVQLGYSTDAATVTTVCGYMRRAINRIREINPTARLCWLFHEMADFKPNNGLVADNDWFTTCVKVMSDVCEKENITFMGLYAGLNLDYVNGHLINDTAKHPNEAGQALIAENVAYNYPYSIKPFVPKRVVTLASDGTYDCTFAKLLLMVSHDIDVTIDYNGTLFRCCSYTSSALIFKSETVTSASSKTEYNLVITSSGATLYVSTASIATQSWGGGETWTTVFDRTARIVSGTPNYVTFTTNETIGANDTWRVTWAGTAYTCTPIYSSQISGYYIGNPKYTGDSTDTGEPFLAYNRTSTQMAFSTNDAAGDITLKIEKKVTS